MLLETNNIGITFGGLKALENISIKVDDNELVGLIGPNGAGKSTLFNLLTGVYIQKDGKISLNNIDITQKKPFERARVGISRTFQNIRLFKDLTCLDNIKIAYQNETNYSNFDAIIKKKKFKNEEEKKNKKALELLEIFDMKILAEQKAQSLSYGQQRRLEIARAIATNPKILLLDEPAAGMNPKETLELMEIIQIIREKFKVAVLLIEHDMKLVMGICEKIYVLNFGRLIASGTPQEIQNNSDVIKAYLGE